MRPRRNPERLPGGARKGAPLQRPSPSCGQETANCPPKPLYCVGPAKCGAPLRYLPEPHEPWFHLCLLAKQWHEKRVPVLMDASLCPAQEPPAAPGRPG